MEASARVLNLREKMLSMPEVCIERGLLMTESYKQTESQPHVIRRAMSVANILQKMSICIDGGELIVGRGSSKQRGGVMTPELNAGWYLEEMDDLSTRSVDRFAPISEADKAKMREFMPYWQDKSLLDMWTARIPEDILKLNNLVQGGGAFCGNNQYFGHSSADYSVIITKGIKGIQQQIKDEIAKLNLADVADFEKYQFLKAANITLEATVAFAKRYAELLCRYGGKRD